MTAQLRRSDDHMWWCRVRWIRRITPVVLVVGGFCWSEAWATYKGMPTASDRARYDAGIEEQRKLAIEVVQMRGEVTQLRKDLGDEKELSEQQRMAILTQLDKLNTKLETWFVGAMRGPNR